MKTQKEEYLDFKYCNGPNCDGALQVNKHGELECPECGQLYCMDCNTPLYTIHYDEGYETWSETLPCQVCHKGEY